MNAPMPPGLRALDTPGLLYQYEDDPQDWPGHVVFHIHPHGHGVEIATFGLIPLVPVEVLRWVTDMAQWIKEVNDRETA